MKYILRKTCFLMMRYKAVHLLLVIEMVLGMAMYVYSLNLSYSVQAKAKQWQSRKEDLMLRISVKEVDTVTEDPPVDLEDYEKIKALAEGDVLFYVAIQDYVVEENGIESFNILLVDYGRFGSSPKDAYLGKNLFSIATNNQLHTELLSVENGRLGIKPDAQKQDMELKELPEEYEGKILKKDQKIEDIPLDNSVILPLTKLKVLSEEAHSSPGRYYLSLDSDGISDVELVSKEIVQYLEERHGEYFVYELYSPEIELRNNTSKTKMDILMVKRVGILMLATLFTGSIAIFRLLLGKRERELGICQACGAGIREVILEIIMEVFVLCFSGTFLGCVGGFALTYRMQPYVEASFTAEGHYQTVVVSILVCIVITFTVATIAIQKIYSKKVIELISS